MYAASFIRKREIVLEAELLRNAETFRLVLAHELFHFAWVRLGNPLRSQYRDLVEDELRHNARGELGESSSVAKTNLVRRGRYVSRQTWSNYLCESFCDSAAWLYAGVFQHSWFTLARRWSEARKTWLDETFKAGFRC